MQTIEDCDAADMQTVVQTIEDCDAVDMQTVVQMVEERSKLPVADSRQYILESIGNNPVVLIRGETGCGKTTQV